MLKKIYLAGTISALEYRAHVHKMWSSKFDIIDPVARSAKELIKRKTSLDEVINGTYYIDDEFVTDIVIEDKKMILSSDYLVAFIEKPTFGTVMEVIYAYTLHKPVFVIAPEDIQKDVWLRYHSNKFFTTIDECFQTLLTWEN